MNYDELAIAVADNKYNPGNIYWHSLQLLEDNLNGVAIEHATTPLATLLAHSVVMSVVNNEEVAKLERMESPEYASTFDELSRFIPYQTLNLIYATPCKVPVTLFLGMQDIIKYAVVEGNVRKVLIPKDTVITYNGNLTFGFYHDLLITLTDGTIVDAVYQDNNNPLEELLSPVIKTNKLYPRAEDGSLGEPVLSLDLNMYQFTKTTSIFPILTATGFNKTLTVPDQYYHARVYTKRNGAWLELTTAFSDFNYNPHSSVPTAIVKLVDDELKISIPYIYITNGLVTSEIKIELYSTKGELTVDLGNSLSSEFNVSFINNDLSVAPYVAPLKAFSTVGALSRSTVTGGRNIPDFEDMRYIVSSANVNAETITEDQLKTKLTQLDYTFIHHSNYLTENVYLASKPLATMRSDGARVVTLGGSIPVLLSDLSDTYGVKENGDNYTLTPNVIMHLENEQARLLSNMEGVALTSLSNGAMVEETNNNRYLSPVFYHVFELNDESNGLHLYHLSSPKVTKRNFIGINANAEGTISVDSVNLIKGVDCFSLVVKTAATSYYQTLPLSSWVGQVNVPAYNGLKLALNHTNVTKGSDGSLTFVFDLCTNYDIRDGKGMRVTNLTGEYGDLSYLPLASTLRLAFCLVDNLPLVNDNNWASDVDDSKLPTQFQVVSLEDISIEIGKSMSSIHRPIRTLAGLTTYQTYPSNVMAYYPEDVPETDEKGYVKFIANPDFDEALPASETNPAFIYPLLHKKDDPIMVNGEHKVKYYAGLPVLDETTGKPIPLGKTPVSIETALIVGDYRLKVAGISQASVSDVIVTNVEKDIDPLRPKMIQLSELYYDVARTVGSTTVRLNVDTSRTIRKDLSFVYDVVVDSVVYSDSAVRALIKKQIKETTAKLINGSKRYVEKDLVSAVSTILNTSVLGFKLISINGMSDIVTFSVSNQFDSIGVAPKLYINTGGQLAIDDDITVNFLLDQ